MRGIGRANGRMTLHRKRSSPLDPVKEYRRTEKQQCVVDSLRAHDIQTVLSYYEKLPAPLTLSNEHNFTEQSRPTEKRRRYGLNGITRKGRDTVEGAAHILEREYGKRRLSFVTLTVPELSLEGHAELHQHWSKALNQFLNWYRERCRVNGWPAEYVYVSEIQEKRYERTGLPVLHVHLVWVGRDRGHWYFEHSDVQEAWGRCIERWSGEPLPLPPRVSLERIKKSAEGYLGKYMSKGAKAVQSVADAGMEDWLPKQWWGCDRKLKGKVKKAETVVSEAPEPVCDLFNSPPDGMWQYLKKVKVEFSDQGELTVAISGKLTPAARKVYESEGWIGLLNWQPRPD